MNGKTVDYHMDSENRFVIDNYNWAKAFSNFLPGIAGKWGIPIWVYYVSRGQGISSLGMRDKDHPILEFHSFNKALQIIDQQGFRTFIKNNNEVYEPFQRVEDDDIDQKMLVSSEELEINDKNPEFGVETNVVYYPIVKEPVPALVRKLRIKNLKNHSLKLELIDGIPRIIPYGVNQDHLKTTARHIEGMMGVEEFNDIPLFRLKQTPADVAQVEKISGGNFYFSMNEEGEILEGKYIVDPAVLFGEPETYHKPLEFEDESIQNLLETKQIRENRTPCAFTAVNLELPPEGEVTLYSVIGTVRHEEKLDEFLETFDEKDFLKRKRIENRELINEIKNYAFTVSSSSKFDQYCQQDFLDNVIRGGMPLVFETKEDKSALYLYSRQNGDLERDYHNFVLEPTYLSQGNGHYRSVLQNRRSDTWFFPEVEDLNIVTFLNLLQTDAYDPLVVTGVNFTVEDEAGLKDWLSSIVEDEDLLDKLMKITKRSFTPGEFIMELEKGLGRSTSEYEHIVQELLSYCHQNDVGELHEGFWVDHWTYNLDLIDTYLEIYPEKLRELLIDREVYTFYDNPDVVRPREEKQVLVNEDKVRRYEAVKRDKDKEEMIENRSKYPTRMRTDYGHGEIYQTNLLEKLFSLLINRMATLDPEGVGIEMEADKPGWNDSLNGLPGLFGSSLCETIELERLCNFLRKSLDKLSKETTHFYQELHEFMNKLDEAMNEKLNSENSNRNLIYWKKTNGIKEDYREKTRMGIDGEEIEVTIEELKEFTDKCLELLNEAFEKKNKIMNENGVPYTYFINKVDEYEIIKDESTSSPKIGPSGYPLVKAESFQQRPVSLFLEGPVHMLKVHPEWSEEIYDSVRESPVFDRKLQMFKCCESLNDEPLELGRIRAYPSGWIENESVYLHMEYKWFLEVLRSGLYEEFYRDMKNAMIPFLDPEIYGRSILEGGSFIASSAFPDESFHGRGFQPRLSGITCEMLHIWRIMVAGEQPFKLDSNEELVLSLQPRLPAWLFTQEEKNRVFYDKNREKKEVEISRNAFAFKFLGKTLVVYHNDSRKDTFGEDKAEPESYRLKYYDGKEEVVNKEVLEESIARDVRNGLVERIDVSLS
ncbi:MAG: cellobiose phosphorylase [Hadesarchaea archaeon]|nr:cellobiose phosphorylase [Hadesarchaea archaeon]